MVLSAEQWCTKQSRICPFRSHPIIQPWLVDRRPRGYVQRDALEEMRSLEQAVWSKWRKLCRSNSFTPAFDLPFSFNWNSFYCQRWLHWYTSWMSLNAYSTTGALRQGSHAQTKKAPTHMSILRRSTVRWARSHHPLDVGRFERREELSQVYMCCVFLLLSRRRRRQRKIIVKGSERSAAHLLHHKETLCTLACWSSSAPEERESGGRVKKSVSMCQALRLALVTNPWALSLGYIWPHGPKEDIHLNRWFLFSTWPQKQEGRKERGKKKVFQMAWGCQISDQKLLKEEAYTRISCFIIYLCVCFPSQHQQYSFSIFGLWCLCQLFCPICIMIWRWVRLSYSGNENILETECFFFPFNCRRQWKLGVCVSSL